LNNTWTLPTSDSDWNGATSGEYPYDDNNENIGTKIDNLKRAISHIIHHMKGKKFFISNNT